MSNYYHYTSSGLSNVWLRNGFTVKETTYGKAVSVHDIEGLHKVIGLYIVKNIPVLGGEEIRFLRKELDFTQLQLANLLGVSETTMRNWENDRQQMAHAAALVLRLIYIDYVNNGTVRELVDRIGQINRESHFKEIELEETEAGWRTAA